MSYTELDHWARRIEQLPAHVKFLVSFEHFRSFVNTEPWYAAIKIDDFEACERSIMPSLAVKHLMERPDVIEAVRKATP